MMLIRGGICLALLSAPALAADVVYEVPEKFLGAWCTVYGPGEEETGESDIRLSQEAISYYRDAGRIVAAVATGNELALIVHLGDDGRTRLAAHEYELSGDGSRLLTLRSDGTLHTRARCSASPQPPPNNSSKPTPLRSFVERPGRSCRRSSFTAGSGAA